MALLSENIRWVGQITLEGERLTADDIVLNRDAVIGARLDRPGIRISFVFVVLLLVAALVLSVTLFLQTLQFFDPNYTRVALSILPFIVLCWASYQLRPRNHLTIMICDGSALVMSSPDGNFLSMCLEAFERLWADKSRARASLYLHAAHRSVDFGPSGGLALAASGSDVNDPLPPMPELPLFEDNEDELETQDEGNGASAPDDAFVEEALPPLPPPPTPPELSIESLPDSSPEPEIDAEPVVTSPPPLPPVVDAPVEATIEPELSIADLLGTDEEPTPEKQEVRIEPQLAEEPVEAGVETRSDDDSDRLNEETAGEDMFALAIAPELEPMAAEPEPVEPEEPAGPVIAVETFDSIRAKVGTLSRLLRDRPDFAKLLDAVDVMDKHIEVGCQNRSEAEDLARAIATMRGPLTVYPAALQVVEAVTEAGDLDRFTDEEPTDA